MIEPLSLSLFKGSFSVVKLEAKIAIFSEDKSALKRTHKLNEEDE
jgi:hypothetical protein